MKLKVTLSAGIICGDDVRDLISIACIDDRLFRQRKAYDEYYFDGHNLIMEIPEGNIFIIAERFPLEIHGDSLNILTDGY